MDWMRLGMAIASFHVNPWTKFIYSLEDRYVKMILIQNGDCTVSHPCSPLCPIIHLSSYKSVYFYINYDVYFVWSVILYFLRPILLLVNTDVSTTKMCLDISTLANNIMDRRE
jgi:hypothetical protein